jgi:predicted house-cleaning NTP pyrophosphatase (Maf/HAM1 superfamily)
LVDQVHGSYTNVVGLPLAEVLKAMAELTPLAGTGG